MVVTFSVFYLLFGHFHHNHRHQNNWHRNCVHFSHRLGINLLLFMVEEFLCNGVTNATPSNTRAAGGAAAFTFTSTTVTSPTNITGSTITTASTTTYSNISATTSIATCTTMTTFSSSSSNTATTSTIFASAAIAPADTYDNKSDRDDYNNDDVSITCYNINYYSCIFTF